MQLGSPANQPAGFVGLLPESGHQRPQQQLLGQAHAGMGWHLEGPQLEQTMTPTRAVRGIELVDTELGPVGIAGDVRKQVPEQAVHHPGRDFFAHRA